MIKIYPHNTLLNVAYYHCCNIKAKNDSKIKKGMTLDCYSCLIFSAFSVEAIINYIGQEKIDCWVDRYERKLYDEKIRILSRKLDFTINDKEEPYKTLQILKNVRNEMAHGKPIKKDVPIKSERHLHMEMKLWSKYATPEYTDYAFHQVLIFRSILGEKIGYSLDDWAVEGGDSAYGTILFSHQ